MLKEKLHKMNAKLFLVLFGLVAAVSGMSLNISTENIYYFSRILNRYWSRSYETKGLGLLDQSWDWENIKAAEVQIITDVVRLPGSKASTQQPKFTRLYGF